MISPFGAARSARARTPRAQPSPIPRFWGFDRRAWESAARKGWAQLGWGFPSAETTDTPHWAPSFTRHASPGPGKAALGRSSITARPRRPSSSSSRKPSTRTWPLAKKSSSSVATASARSNVPRKPGIGLHPWQRFDHGRRTHFDVEARLAPLVDTLEAKILGGFDTKLPRLGLEIRRNLGKQAFRHLLAIAIAVEHLGPVGEYRAPLGFHRLDERLHSQRFPRRHRLFDGRADRRQGRFESRRGAIEEIERLVETREVGLCDFGSVVTKIEDLHGKFAADAIEPPNALLEFDGVGRQVEMKHAMAELEVAPLAARFGAQQERNARLSKTRDLDVAFRHR